jgi:hypothetical protein
MKSAKDHLIDIQKHLSDKERWEELWESNRITGYSSGSLSNDLAGIWCTSKGTDKAAYPAAYACVGKAIIDICGTSIRNTKAYSRNNYVSQDDDPYPPDENDLRLVDALADIKDHALLMQILDLSIRYANLLVFF